MNKLWIIGIVMLLIIPFTIGEEWTRPPTTPGGVSSGYCSDGTCDGSLYIPGNLTVTGTYVNITTINFNVTGNINVTQNVTAMYFIGDGSFITGLGNDSGWNHSGNLTYTHNYKDHVGVGTNRPDLAHIWSNNFVIQEFEDEGGMTIRTDDNQAGVIDFSDCDTGGTCSYRGYIVYDHGQDRMEIGAESSTMLWLDHPEKEVRVHDNLLVDENLTVQGNLSVFEDANFSSNVKIDGTLFGGSPLDIGSDVELAGDLNVTGSINVTQNVTADWFFGKFNGNGSIWNRSETGISPANAGDNVTANYFIGNGSQLTDIGNFFNRTGTNLYPANIADELGLGHNNPSSLLDVVGTNYMLAEFRGSGYDCHTIVIDAVNTKDALVSFQESTVTRWTIGNDGTTDTFNWRYGPALECLSGGVYAMQLSSDSNLTINRSLTAFGHIELNRTIFTDDVGNVEVRGDLNITGNFTGNQIYGEMWYHNHTATVLNFAVDGVYYNLTFTNATINGFTFNNAGDYLQALVAGRYKTSYMASGSGQNNHVYYTDVTINGVVEDKCESHKKMTAGGDIVTMTGSCFIDLAVNDIVKLATADIGGTGAGNYYSSNLNLVRIGS